MVASKPEQQPPQGVYHNVINPTLEGGVFRHIAAEISSQTGTDDSLKGVPHVMRKMPAEVLSDDLVTVLGQRS